LSKLHKFFGTIREAEPVLTAFLSRKQTFSASFDGRFPDASGDVTIREPLQTEIMAYTGAIFPQAEARLERGEIPVENSYFSTFSTSFSTGVFHRERLCGKLL
jgi:hypothetical protein